MLTNDTPNTILLNSLEPWQLLLKRIVGQAARDYCDPRSSVHVQRSAAVFFWHAGIRGRRIRQAAHVYAATLAAEDTEVYDVAG